MSDRLEVFMFPCLSDNYGYLIHDPIQNLTASIDTPHQQNLADYGRNLGLCFQIIDDLLDYTGDTSNTGKNIGDDLKDGKMTLPLIYALKSLNDEYTA